MAITKIYTREYNTYCNMKQRCLNPNNPNYKHYGLRGIKVCDRWLNSFKNFLSDMGSRPKGYTLDRIDNNKGYSPKNCRWATQKQQVNNRRKPCTSVFITYEGNTKTLTEWASFLDIGVDTLWRRLNVYNQSVGKALTNKKRVTTSKGVINLDTGETFFSIIEAAEHYNIDPSSLTKACKGKLKTSGGYKWEYLFT